MKRFFTLCFTIAYLLGSAPAIAQPGGRMAVTLPTYGAPSDMAGMEAFNQRAAQLVMDGREGYDRDEEIDLYSSDVAISLQINQCVWTQQPKINPAEFGLLTNLGYFCRFSVVPLENMPFDTVGFFIHDGFEWRYFGRVQQSPEAMTTVMADFDDIKIQPYADSPYYTRPDPYQFDSGQRIDDTPYVGNGGFYQKDPNDAQMKEGELQRGFYERFNNPALIQLDNAIRQPKGSKY